jgi:hypothetical protein
VEKDLEREEQREDSEHGDRENGPETRKQLKYKQQKGHQYAI